MSPEACRRFTSRTFVTIIILFIIFFEVSKELGVQCTLCTLTRYEKHLFPGCYLQKLEGVVLHYGDNGCKFVIPAPSALHNLQCILYVPSKVLAALPHHLSCLIELASRRHAPAMWTATKLAELFCFQKGTSCRYLQRLRENSVSMRM